LLPPGEAIVIADGPDAVLQALALPQARRLAIGQAARARVLAAHTGRARARELTRALSPQDLAATGT
ncbi:MAG TPA: glycosyltransferase, partial [Rubellimicrobium sp.]|nr:glycosyltransferase [Rubellimicrobium sp.]